MLAPLENPTAIDAARVEAVGLRRRPDEVAQVLRALGQVLHVKDALGQPPEEARHPVFQHLPARTEQGGLGHEHPPQFQQAVFVAARAVQQQQRRRVRPRRRDEPMDKAQMSSLIVPSRSAMKSPLIAFG